MKKMKKPLYILCATLLAVFITLGLLSDKLAVFAGFGDYNDYGSYDSYSYDSYSYDSYDSYDYYDDDDDYGYDYYDDGYYYGGGYSSYGGYGYDSSVFSYLVQVFVVVVILYATVSLLKKAKKNSPQSNTNRTFYPTPPYKPMNRTAEIASYIQRLDPNFDSKSFISFASKVYMDIQLAWCNRDLSPVRGVLHQNLYEQTDSQVQRKISEGIINHLNCISILDTYLENYKIDNDYESITVYLVARMIDYQENEATGQIILGDDHTLWTMEYHMTFSRSLKVKTESPTDEAKALNCPNCGAPLPSTAYSKCPYCDSIVTTDEYNWVLFEFRGKRI